MKKFKRIMALVIALAMVLTMMSMTAFARPTGGLTADTSVTVGGLDSGDSVKFVKMIEWVDSTGWDYTADFKAAAAACDPAITLPDVKVIVGTADPAKAGEISAANGGILGKVATKMIEQGKVAATVSAAEVTPATDPKTYNATYSKANGTEDSAFVGLYVAMVTPGTPNYNYNPVYVAADYSQESTSPNTFDVNLSASYSDTALAKKNEVKLTKESTPETADNAEGADNIKYDHSVGDEVSFKVKSQIPAFSSSYVDPTFEISDVLDSGLELKNYDNLSSIVSVKIGGSTAALNTDYTISGNTKQGFTLNVTSTKLAQLTVATEIEITYAATITSIDNANVNQKTNTATVKFSNNPADKNSYSLLEDKTNHYTFSIDALAIGNEAYEHSELVKIGTDKNGNELTQNTTLSNTTTAHALQDAEFKLYKSDQTTPYTNSKYTAETVFKSLDDGRILIEGLDAGTYYLEETKAPAGYIKADGKIKIEIQAEYEEIPAGTYTNADGKTVKYDAYKVLKEYKVIVNGESKNTTTGVTTSTYTFDNGTKELHDYDVADTKPATEGDTTGKIKNVQGTELPSTGGIGTTIFYVVGAILVLGAGVVLITRRRMGA